MIFKHQDYQSITSPPGFKASYPPIGTLSTYGAGEVKLGLKRCRFYIPPGASHSDVQMMMTQPAEAIVIARMGSPIQGDYSQYALDDLQFLRLPSRGAAPDQLSLVEYVGRNASGMLTICKGPAIKGGWLYIQVLIRKGELTNGNFSFTIDFSIYRPWYDSVVWDSAGDPAEIQTPPKPSAIVDFGLLGKHQIPLKTRVDFGPLGIWKTPDGIKFNKVIK